MANAPAKSVHEVVRNVGEYPEEAFHFVREGLSRGVQSIHGPATPELETIAQYMADNEFDLHKLREQYDLGELDHTIRAAIQEAGGIERINRHVSGQDLCWALRNLAVERWGPLSRLVLRRWNVRTTADFGRIVFALIEHGFLQKQPHDRQQDFDNVYDFDEALTVEPRIPTRNKLTDG